MLTPFRQDTNSLYLTARLNELGVEVEFKTIVGDRREQLVEACRIALRRAAIVLISGGLGPTEDDLTRECAAEALGVDLRRDHTVVTELYTRYAERRMSMPPGNAKQADYLEGATVLKNDRGTAPGQFWSGKFEEADKIVVLLPGPPFELKAMWEQQCQPRLKALLPPSHIALRELRIAMIGESLVDQRAAKIYTQYPDIRTTILASAGEVQLHLRREAATMEEAEARVEELAAKLEEEFGDDVFSTNGEKLEQIAGYYLQMRGATLAVAESCTGGLLSQRITSVSGASRYFLGGAIVYSNDLKTGFTDVPPLLIAEKGAVSPEVAVSLAEGIRKRCRATLGVGITGIAGPNGGTEEKPVGTVCLAIAAQTGTKSVQKLFKGDREHIRMWAAQQALDMIRRELI
jgi:nicotinamide-nucleotide amidase